MVSWLVSFFVFLSISAHTAITQNFCTNAHSTQTRTCKDTFIGIPLANENMNAAKWIKTEKTTAKNVMFWKRKEKATVNNNFRANTHVNAHTEREREGEAGTRTAVEAMKQRNIEINSQITHIRQTHTLTHTQTQPQTNWTGWSVSTWYCSIKTKRHSLKERNIS